MKVEAELKTLYKITVGDDGVCMGHYYPEDDWEESYYGETLKEIAEEMSIEYINGYPMEKFSFEQVEVLIYNGARFDYRTIQCLSRYENNNTLDKEFEEFNQYWKDLEPERAKMREIKKLKEEREEKMRQIKNQQEKEEKEKAEYLKLKEKYEK